jgi:hypothetical protein
VAAPQTPLRRAVLLFGPTRAQRSSGNSGIERRCGVDVVYSSSPHPGAAAGGAGGLPMGVVARGHTLASARVPAVGDR